MARMRMVKPEFWASEQVVECSPLARLLFIGLWNFCDDRGVHPASCKRLKMEVFPADSVEVDPLIDELLAVNLITTFEAEGQSYWHVTGWDRHQRTSHPFYKYPPPKDVNGSGALRSTPEHSGAYMERSDLSIAEHRVDEIIVMASKEPPVAIDVDWEAARTLANEAVRSLELNGMTISDRRLLLTGAAIEQSFDRVFSDSYRQTAKVYRSGTPPSKGKCAYLYGAMVGKLKDIGRDYKAVSAAIEVPKEFLCKPATSR